MYPKFWYPAYPILTIPLQNVWGPTTGISGFTGNISSAMDLVSTLRRIDFTKGRFYHQADKRGCGSRLLIHGRLAGL